MKEKKSFLIHKDSLCVLDEMTNEQAGVFIKAIKQYQETGTIPELDFAMKMAFTPFKLQFDRDGVSYENKVESNKNAAHIRWNKVHAKESEPMQVHASVSKSIQPNAKHADSDSDKDKDKDNKKENDNVAKTAIPPLPEFLFYAKEKCLAYEYDYETLKPTIMAKYDSWIENGWCVQKDKKMVPILKWKSTLGNTLPFLNLNHGKQHNSPTKKKFVAPDYSHLVEKIG